MQDKVQAAKEELDKLKNETKTKLKKLKEALSNKENVELKDHYDVCEILFVNIYVHI